MQTLMAVAVFREKEGSAKQKSHGRLCFLLAHDLVMRRGCLPATRFRWTSCAFWKRAESGPGRLLADRKGYCNCLASWSEMPLESLTILFL